LLRRHHDRGEGYYLPLLVTDMEGSASLDDDVHLGSLMEPMPACDLMRQDFGVGETIGQTPVEVARMQHLAQPGVISGGEEGKLRELTNEHARGIVFNA
jgi:hypothetical protein